jgi:type I restriction enzyme S subunit
MRLKQICSTYSEYGINISADSYTDSGVAIIRTSDFDDYGRLDLASVKFVDELYTKGKILSKGDLLFSRSGTIGRCMVFDREKIPATFAAYLVRFKPKKQKALSQYILYWSQSGHFTSQVNTETIESTIGNFNGTKFANLKFPERELSQQKEIVSFLDKETARIDLLIEKKKRFITLIQEKKLSLANQALDGSIIKSDRAGAKEWFGILPSNWKTLRAKYLFKEAQNRSEEGSEELLTVSHITGVTKRSEKDVNMFMAETMEGYKLVSKSDVVVNTMWAWMGAMGVSPHNGLVSPSYGVYRPLNNDFFEDEYLDLIIRSKAFIAEATKRSKGIHSSRLRLYPDAFLDILFPVPEIEVQKQIVLVYKNATMREDKIVALNNKSIELLKTLRSSLITETISGELNVEAWEKRGISDKYLDQIEEVVAS